MQGPSAAPFVILLAHGAGAPMTSPFLESLTDALIADGHRVIRFEFAYMAARRESGKRRPPPKAEALMGEFNDAIATLSQKCKKGQRVVIAGKSLGGRVASMVADEQFASGHIAALLCFGFPFHPPKKPEATRTRHLETLKCPALIVQGTRDPFGTREDVTSYRLSKRIAVSWIEGGDHDFALPRTAKLEGRSGILQAAESATWFLRSTLGP